MTTESPPRSQQLFGIPIQNTTMEAAIESILDRTNRDAPTQISFVNADCVNISFSDEDYLAVLRHSDLNYCDGIGMKIAGRLLGRPLVDNVNGTDMLPQLCTALQGTGKRIYLLGAKPGVAERASKWIAGTYPTINVCGVRNGYFSTDEEPQVIAEIAASRADILLVAFGVPRQEKWIRQHLSALQVKVAIGVGGLFDFYSGNIPRAPLWMRRCGLEWLWRWYQEPRRLFRRYFVGNPLFVFRVLRERLRGDRPFSNHVGPSTI